MQHSDVILAQSFIEEDQFINLHAAIVIVYVCSVSSDNNTVSSWKPMWSLGRASCHFCSIVVDPVSLSIVGSEVVHYNVGPARGFGSTCAEGNILSKDLETTAQCIFSGAKLNRLENWKKIITSS